jgi:hypothetical protein
LNTMIDYNESIITFYEKKKQKQRICLTTTLIDGRPLYSPNVFVSPSIRKYGLSGMRGWLIRAIVLASPTRLTCYPDDGRRGGKAGSGSLMA